MDEILKTPYEETLDKANPLPEYPRPQMVRESYISLNGEWDFAVSDDANEYEFDSKITVPFAPESRLSGYNKRIPKDCTMHYRRIFSLPDGFMRDRLLLHIGACDTIADLYVNGKPCFHNEGGYLPFTVDITEALSEGDNEIRVRLRSRFVTINKIAEKYEGGGHACASGATVHGIDQMNELISDADNLLGEFKNSNEGWL